MVQSFFLSDLIVNGYPSKPIKAGEIGTVSSKFVGPNCIRCLFTLEYTISDLFAVHI